MISFGWSDNIRRSYEWILDKIYFEPRTLSFTKPIRNLDFRFRIHINYKWRKQ
ncbi:hypothetical protein O3G_MSEX013676 [Manduca sexta]|uniref:Uncharacterized protein n=1 Tax=Manduca sexta TaxID=7130 RepID=A0A922CYI9_MANSE|nr:hypothetical protein O3G_MSEX013676 [Manduca sexta]